MNKQDLSRAVKKLFYRIGIYDFLRRLKPNPSVAILRYHAVVDQENNFYTSPSIALAPADFEDHVKYFSSKYRVLSLDQIIDYLKQNKVIPPNSIAFTFDDGYADNFDAAQILNNYNAVSTFYITADPIDRKSGFWLAELIGLVLKTKRQELNISFNSTNLHYSLNDLASRWQAITEITRKIKSNNQVAREIIRSQLLEQLGESDILKMIENSMLTWTQIDQMKKMNMTIGSHTLTHLNLPNADPNDAVHEIQQSKNFLEEKIGSPVDHFSYPNSGPYEYFNDRIKAYVQDAGYKSSTTSMQGFVNQGSDFFVLRRIRTMPILAEVVHSLEWERIFQKNL